jgi:hypothetical protein
MAGDKKPEWVAPKLTVLGAARELTETAAGPTFDGDSTHVAASRRA